jgi:hypothetical protein
MESMGLKGQAHMILKSNGIWILKNSPRIGKFAKFLNDL